MLDSQRYPSTLLSYDSEILLDLSARSQILLLQADWLPYSEQLSIITPVSKTHHPSKWSGPLSQRPQLRNQALQSPNQFQFKSQSCLRVINSSLHCALFRYVHLFLVLKRTRFRHFRLDYRKCRPSFYPQ